MKNLTSEQWYHPNYIMNYTHSQPKQNTYSKITPKDIYNYLDSRIYNQNEAKKAASLFVWKTLQGVKENAFFIGPSGCGKTMIFTELSQREPLKNKICIVDASNITLDGWKGEKKITTLFDNNIFKTNEQTILVLDEMDKALYPKISSGGDDYSKSLQGELLKALERTHITVGKNENKFCVDTYKINFALLGAFSLKANDIAEKQKGCTIGFNADTSNVTPYFQPITSKDLLDFGVMSEFMGRIQRIVNLSPLTEKDYFKLLSERKLGPIKKLENIYGISLRLKKKTTLKLANEAFTDGLGIRGIENKLQTLIDDTLFDDCSQKYFEF